MKIRVEIDTVCKRCKRINVEHYAKGMCNPCYQLSLLDKKKKEKANVSKEVIPNET